LKWSLIWEIFEKIKKNHFIIFLEPSLKQPVRLSGCQVVKGKPYKLSFLARGMVWLVGDPAGWGTLPVT